MSLGTTPFKIVTVDAGYEVDFVIQNLSANNVYFLEDNAQETSQGIKLVATTGSLSKDHWTKTVWIVADGATSDVRYVYQIRKIGTTTTTPPPSGGGGFDNPWVPGPT